METLKHDKIMVSRITFVFVQHSSLEEESELHFAHDLEVQSLRTILKPQNHGRSPVQNPLSKLEAVVNVAGT